ncbi:unnamed protein product [Prunus armeniaca]|uniref:Uncharacterized protein n=1 Tax=Prunus armeniaca TaxID=36596 RepID=A0A6J5YAC8_PRUAR|nr:unnamed protein product [Prunus armeniaca]CAB4321343.1 unnamed protein product [Prunus armeniaca]
MNNAVVPRGQVYCLTRASRVVQIPNKPGCLPNLVNVAGKAKLLVAAPTPTPFPIQTIQSSRRRSFPLMATSHHNADIANNNFPFIPSSYGDPCLDLFFNALIPDDRDTNQCLTYLKQMLPLAWSHNPLATLKLIFSAESIGFFLKKLDTAVLWLHQNHPNTLLHNLHSIADLPGAGSFYALVQIMYVLLVQKEGGQGKYNDAAADLLNLHPERYDRDPDYRLFHDRVIDVFVERLKSDIEKMKQHTLELEPSDYLSDDDEDDVMRQCVISEYVMSEYHRPCKVSAAECCTSKNVWDDHRARAIFLRESIARRLFPPESDPSEEWELLRKDFLVPLTNYYKRRRVSESRQLWVKKYLEEVKAGGGTGIINPDALLPNEIIDYVYEEDEDVGEAAAELQWKAMVDMYLKQQQKQGEGLGKFKNWLVVGGIPNNFAACLRFLMSELSEEPWKGKFIGGDEDEPEWIQGEGHDLKSKCKLMRKSDDYFGFLKAIDLILEVGVNANLKAEHMIKKVIVFQSLKPGWICTSVWHYDQLVNNVESIRSKYKDKGYGDDAVPHIVLWDVCEDWSIPHSWICTQHPGFTRLSGFSGHLVKSFLDNGGEIGPHHLMEAVIADKEYQALALVD